MKRRAVRRFEEGGVDRDVIERIARLAQRTLSAGFSQGQRLVVVTGENDDARWRGCAARRNTGTSGWGRGSPSAPRSSSRASRRRPTTAATGSPTSSRTTAPRSTGRSPTGGSTSARRCRTSCSRRSTRASDAGSSEPTRPAGSSSEPCSGSRTSSSRSVSCRSDARCPTFAHRRSSEAGCHSGSSPA